MKIVINIIFLLLITINLNTPILKASTINLELGNELFTAVQTNASSTPGGDFDVNISEFSELESNRITSGDQIVYSFDNTCPGVIEPDVTDSVAFDSDSSTGDFGTFSTAENKLIFTFNEKSDDTVLSAVNLMFSFNIELVGDINELCALNMEVIDDGNVVDTNSVDIQFKHMKPTSSYVPVTLFLDDTQTGLNNIRSSGSTSNNRQDLFSKGYYEVKNIADPIGGIIDNNSSAVGQTIWLNRYNPEQYSDLEQFEMTYTLDHELELDESFGHRVYVTEQSDVNKNTYDVTDLLEPEDYVYDSNTNVLSVSMQEADFTEAEDRYGINLNNPSIYIYFGVDINNDSIPSLDNDLYGSGFNYSGVTAENAVYANVEKTDQIDAADGYPNEGKVSASFTDHGVTEQWLSRFSFQERSKAAGAALKSDVPTLTSTISDSDEKAVTDNTILACDQLSASYEVDFNTGNLQLGYDNLGTISLQFPTDFKYQLADVQVLFDSESIALNNQYFEVNKVGNDLQLEFKDSASFDIEELLYIPIKISVDGKFTGSSDSVMSSTWQIGESTYQFTPITTKLKTCSGQIKLLKTDENNLGLKGAEFSVYDQFGNKQDTIITGSDGYGISSKLPLGEYTIEETKAPAGYVLNKQKFTVKIEQNNQIKLVNDGKPIINQKLKPVVDDDSDSGYLEIFVQNGNGEKYWLYDDDGDLVEVLTIEDGYAKSKNLDYGTYCLKSEDNESFCFEISKENKVQSYHKTDQTNEISSEVNDTNNYQQMTVENDRVTNDNTYSAEQGQSTIASSPKILSTGRKQALVLVVAGIASIIFCAYVIYGYKRKEN